MTAQRVAEASESRATKLNSRRATTSWTWRDDEMSHGAGASGTTTEFREYQWAYSVMDSSRVSTCLISMLLIVYGSFRSLNMEQEQREREKKRQSDSMNNLLTGEPIPQEQSM